MAKLLFLSLIDFRPVGLFPQPSRTARFSLPAGPSPFLPFSLLGRPGSAKPSSSCCGSDLSSLADGWDPPRRLLPSAKAGNGAAVHPSATAAPERHGLGGLSQVRPRLFKAPAAATTTQSTHIVAPPSSAAATTLIHAGELGAATLSFLRPIRPSSDARLTVRNPQGYSFRFFPHPFAHPSSPDLAGSRRPPFSVVRHLDPDLANVFTRGELAGLSTLSRSSRRVVSCSVAPERVRRRSSGMAPPCAAAWPLFPAAGVFSDLISVTQIKSNGR